MRFTDITRYDPVNAFQFRVIVGGVETVFSEISGLSMEVTPIEYREGGDAPIMRAQPGIMKSGPITLKRGSTQDPDMFIWFSTVVSVAGLALPDQAIRRNMTILALDRSGIPLKGYTVYRCWPSQFKGGDWNAKNNEVLMEEIVIQNEGYDIVSTGFPLPIF